jgi:hypothetical protein
MTQQLSDHFTFCLLCGQNSSECKCRKHGPVSQSNTNPQPPTQQHFKPQSTTTTTTTTNNPQPTRTQHRPSVEALENWNRRVSELPDMQQFEVEEAYRALERILVQYKYSGALAVVRLALKLVAGRANNV